MKNKMRKMVTMLTAVSMTAAMMMGGLTASASEDDIRTTVEKAFASDYQEESISLALAADDVEFSPWSGNDGGRGYNVWLMYQPLAWLVDGEVTPCLMESYEVTGPASCTVKIFDYIKDSQGNEIKASDVAFSFEKAQAEGRVVGATYFDTVTAVDDYTLEFTFKKDLSLGELEQTFSQVYIVSEKAWNESGDEMLLNPVGTGRYVLGDYVSGSSITFTENENYWQTNEDLITVRDLANVKNITFYIISEATQRAIAVEEGSVDYADLTIADVENVKAAGKNVYEYPNTLTFQMAANCAEESILNNKDLRNAVFYCLDSNNLVAGLTSTTGFPVYDMLCFNYVDYLEAFESEDNFYTNPSVEKAAEYLAAAGYSAGEVTLNLITESTQISTDLATITQALLSQIGINVQINTYQSNMVTTNLEDRSAWDLYIYQRADNLYLVNAWANPLYEDNFSWGGSVNYVFDDTLQELLAAARGVDTHNEETILACHDYIVENAYIRGLVGYYSQYAYSEKFESLFYNEKGFLAPNCCTYQAN